MFPFSSLNCSISSTSTAFSSCSSPSAPLSPSSLSSSPSSSSVSASTSAVSSDGFAFSCSCAKTFQEKNNIKTLHRKTLSKWFIFPPTDAIFFILPFLKGKVNKKILFLRQSFLGNAVNKKIPATLELRRIFYRIEINYLLPCRLHPNYLLRRRHRQHRLLRS